MLRRALPLIMLALISCDSDPASEDVSPKFTLGGHFQCVRTSFGKGLAVLASANIPPKGLGTVSISTPPGSPRWLKPERIRIRCEVDSKQCEGMSCGGDPPVDFYPTHGGDLSWKITDDSGETQFTAIGYNDDPLHVHRLSLRLEMPPDWTP
jgi:hypothetical protein